MAAIRGKRKARARKKRVLSDAQYLAAKARAARSKERGDGFELLILLFYVIRSADLYLRGISTLAADAVVHLYNGEFVDDLKLASISKRVTRYVHAKSGTSVRWNRNLIRDFTTQRTNAQPDVQTILELWVGTREKRQEMIGNAPAGLPRIRYHVLPEPWLDQHPSEIPRILRPLSNCVRQVHSPSLVRKAWDRIKAAQSELGRNTSVAAIMAEASYSTHGTVRSLAGSNSGVAAFLSKVGEVEGLVLAADGDTLLFWNETISGLCSEDMRRVPWPVLQRCLESGKSPKTRDDFFLLLGAVL
jgi:hypothetical protein